MNRHRRLEPDPPDEAARRLSGVDFDFAARHRAVAVLRAHRRLLHADRPDAAAAAEQRAQAVDGVEKIAAVALHHRQQQVAAGVAAELGVLERRQPRQQHAARFARVARQRQRALQDVARRQHAELVAQLPGAAAAVEHRDDGVQVQPGIVSSGRRAGSAVRCRRRSSRRSAGADASRHSSSTYNSTAQWTDDPPDAVQTLERDLREIFGRPPAVARRSTDNAHGRPAHAPARTAHGARAARRRTLAIVDSLTARRSERLRRPRRGVARRRPGDAAAASPPTSSSTRSTRSRSSSARSSPTTRVVAGANPFASLAVDPADLRRACEVQARSHLLHLREGFLETRGRADALAVLIVRVGGGRSPRWSRASRGSKATPPTMPARRRGTSSAMLGTGNSAVAEVVKLAQCARHLRRPTRERLFPPYLEAVERLVTLRRRLERVER